jgi:phosphoenolpyruvate carboxykinase (ATP)
MNWNLPSPALYEEALKRNEGIIAHLGPLVVRTGQFTGRSPNDKFIVDEPTSRGCVWWGEVNRPITEERFDELHRRMASYLQGKDVFVQDVYCGADPDHRLPVRILTQYAWHSLFARNMFILPEPEDQETFEPEFVVIDCPGFHAFPEVDGTNSDAFILVNFAKKLVLIGGTEYAGEIKKSVFTAMNGVFNFEGGCYAKVIKLSPEAEPEIYQTTRTYGTILENVGIDADTRRLDLDDASLTENTRAAYPISHIPNASRTGLGNHPKNIIFLTADAFGVLPPISRLTPEQTMYHFISGYTAKVAGTERGITEPKATFSACFGAPFMAQHPSVYADLLGHMIDQHDVKCWLINTGWTGGPFGEGQRIKIAYTRAMVDAALNGDLDQVEYAMDPLFGLQVPATCPDVPDDLLQPRRTWQDPEAYDRQAQKLAQMFVDNFSQFTEHVSEEIRNASPVVE